MVRASAHLPPSCAFVRQSSLAKHQPGTAAKLRSEDNIFFVLVDKHESRFRLLQPH
jgi:hypothetical protein